MPSSIGKTLRVLGPVLAVLLAACQPGSGEGLDASGRPLAESANLPLGPTLASIQVNVFDRSCAVSGCHLGPAAALGLRLDAGFSYARLVGQSSVEQAGVLRVAPGDPDRSYLVHKLEGTAAVGARMPLNQPALAAAEIAAIRAWIAAGAEPIAGATAARVVSVDPPDRAVVATLPATITLTFSRAMDAATLNSATVRLERSGVDRSFSEGNEIAIVPAAITLDPLSLDRLTLDLAGAPGDADVYRLRLSGDGPVTVLDADGVALDGDADGMPGGDFDTTFFVGDRFVGMQANLASIQEAVFTPVCTQCHYGPVPAEDLNLEEGLSYDELVNVPRRFGPEIRVIPFDAANSYLVWKLEGVQLTMPSQGARMPLNGPYLPQTAIDVIRAWIDAGAAPSP